MLLFFFYCVMLTTIHYIISFWCSVHANKESWNMTWNNVMLLSILTWNSNCHYKALGNCVCYTSDIVYCCNTGLHEKEKGVCILLMNLYLLQMFYYYHWIFQCRLDDNLSSRNLVFLLMLIFPIIAGKGVFWLIWAVILVI